MRSTPSSVSAVFFALQRRAVQFARRAANAPMRRSTCAAGIMALAMEDDNSARVPHVSHCS